MYRRLSLLLAVALAVAVVAPVVVGQQHIQKVRKTQGVAATEPCWFSTDISLTDAGEPSGSLCLDCDTTTSGAEDCSWYFNYLQDGAMTELFRLESDPFAMVVGSSGNGEVTATGTFKVIADSAISGSNHTITLQEGAAAMAVFSPALATITPPVTLESFLKLTPVARLADTTCNEAGEAGTIYASTTGNDFCYCDGSAWQALSGTDGNCVIP